MEVSLLSLWEYFLRAIQYSCDWVITTLVNPVFEGFIDLISPYLPSVEFDLSSFMTGDMYALLSSWFPFSYGVTCLVSYFVIAAAVYIVNWVLGLIPTVS